MPRPPPAEGHVRLDAVSDMVRPAPRAVPHANAHAANAQAGRGAKGEKPRAADALPAVPPAKLAGTKDAQGTPVAGNNSLSAKGAELADAANPMHKLPISYELPTRGRLAANRRTSQSASSPRRRAEQPHFLGAGLPKAELQPRELLKRRGHLPPVSTAFVITGVRGQRAGGQTGEQGKPTSDRGKVDVKGLGDNARGAQSLAEMLRREGASREQILEGVANMAKLVEDEDTVSADELAMGPPGSKEADVLARIAANIPTVEHLTTYDFGTSSKDPISMASSRFYREPKKESWMTDEDYAAILEALHRLRVDGTAYHDSMHGRSLYPIMEEEADGGGVTGALQVDHKPGASKNDLRMSDVYFIKEATIRTHRMLRRRRLNRLPLRGMDGKPLYDPDEHWGVDTLRRGSRSSEMSDDYVEFDAQSRRSAGSSAAAEAHQHHGNARLQPSLNDGANGTVGTLETDGPQGATASKPAAARRRAKATQTDEGEPVELDSVPKHLVQHLIHEDLTALMLALQRDRHMPLAAIIQLVANTAQKVTNADRATVFLCEENNTELWGTYRAETDTTGGKSLQQEQKLLRMRLRKSDNTPNGIACHCVCSGDLINIADAYQDDRFNPKLDKTMKYKTTSVLTAPMVIGALGDSDMLSVGCVMVVNKSEGKSGKAKDSSEPVVFDERDERLIRACCAIAAAALDKAHASQRAVQYEMLKRAMRMFAGPEREDELRRSSSGAIQYDRSDVRAVLLRTLDAAKEMVSVERCTVFIVNAEQREIWTMHADGMNTQFSIPLYEDGAWCTEGTPAASLLNRGGTGSTFKTGIAAWVVTQGESFMTNDMSLCELWDPKTDLLSGFNTRSMMCVPLRNSETGIVIGCVQLMNKLGADGNSSFTVDDLELVELLARMSVANVTRAQMSTELNKRAEISDVVSQAMLHIADAKDPEKVITSLLVYMSEIIEFQFGVALSTTPKDDVAPSASAVAQEWNVAGWCKPSRGSEEQRGGGSADAVLSGHRRSSLSVGGELDGTADREQLVREVRLHARVRDAEALAVESGSGSTTVDASRGLLRVALERKAVLHIPYVTDHRGYDAAVDKFHPDVPPIAHLYIPLLTRSGEPFGMLVLVNRRREALGNAAAGDQQSTFREFLREDISVAEAMSRVAGVVVDNIRLNERFIQRHGRDPTSADGSGIWPAMPRASAPA